MPVQFIDNANMFFKQFSLSHYSNQTEQSQWVHGMIKPYIQTFNIWIEFISFLVFFFQWSIQKINIHRRINSNSNCITEMYLLLFPFHKFAKHNWRKLVQTYFDTQKKGIFQMIFFPQKKNFIFSLFHFN